MNLLLVDKDRGDLVAFKQALQQSGFSAHALWSGNKSESNSQEFFSGLVLVALPKAQVNQYELMQRIRAIDAFSMAPILFCHCCETPENLAQILFVDGKEFLPQNISYGDIVHVLSEFLVARAA